jgi:PhnB protein
MKAVNPYLNFPGNTEEAFEFYRSVFGGEFVGGVRRFSDFGGAMGELPEADRNKVAHVALPLGDGAMLMGTDALESHGRTLTIGNNVYISLDVETEAEIDRLFSALSEGGRVEMPLAKTEWSDRYGICVDRFGVQWMLGYYREAS